MRFIIAEGGSDELGYRLKVQDLSNIRLLQCTRVATSSGPNNPSLFSPDFFMDVMPGEGCTCLGPRAQDFQRIILPNFKRDIATLTNSEYVYPRK